MRDKRKLYVFLRMTFIFYIVFLFKMILFKYYGPVEILRNGNRQLIDGVNLEPFRGIATSSFLRKDFIWNIVAFLPLGVYYGLFNRERPIFKGLIISLALSLFFEASQYIFKIGGLDVNDLMANGLGGFLGIVLLKLSDRWMGVDNTDLVVSVLATIIMTLLIVMIFLLLAFS